MCLQKNQLIFLFITLIFCLTNLSAQNNETELYQPFSPSHRPVYSDNLPEFVKMTFQANPNFNAIEAAFEEFEKEEKAEKAKKRKNTVRQDSYGEEGGQNRSASTEEENENIYEVYYERWKRAYKPFVQDDGSILLPTVADYKRKIHTENRENQQRVAARNSAANWTCIGPKETFFLKNDRTTQPACPWQVNIYAFDISKSNPSVLYACPETGGVFKTTDKGLNWTACGSSSFNFGGTAEAVEIHPTDPDIVYVSINSFFWKTIDGGKNWVDLTNCSATGVNDIAISPADPNIVMVAADNGFFRSINGGSTWSRPFTTACYDIEFNPSDATHVFILKSNGTKLEFLKSTDSGTFTTLNTTYTVTDMGFTTLTKGRLAVTAADGSRIYALCLSSTNPPKLLKSADEGETWTNMNATFCTGGISDATGGQGYYDLSIAASQSNANELIFGMSSQTKAVSTDGGATFTYTNLGGYCGSFALHPDLQEAKTIMNNGVMEAWVATDGGLTYSTDFFTSTSNAFARNNGIYNTDFWGYSQGWNEDIMVGGRYHNGNTALSDSYSAGQALRLGGGEAGTGYVLQGNSRRAVFSDIGSLVLPLNFSDYGTWGSYGKYPNEAGYGFNASSFVIHPNYFKQQFVGEGNNLWKTTDNGVTFVSLKDFGSPVRRFEVSRSNPSVIYAATDAGFNKSTDGGATWTTVALPSGKSAGSLYLAINPTNDQDVWICFNNVSGSGKVYQSTSGGSSWTTMDGTVFSSFKIKNIIHTGGGVYIAADGDQGRVFYRSNSTMSWTDFSDNLPVSMNILKMLPFYRDGKLRVAGNRGVWETPLAAAVVPVALPTVDKPTSGCVRDTFYLDSYSITTNPTTYQWTISPTPTYISDATARNPKVVLGAIGNYSVTLAVTDANGTSSRTVTNMLQISQSSCSPDVVAGDALDLSSATRGGATLPSIPIAQMPFTISLWVKPTALQNSFSQIIGQSNDALNSGSPYFSLGFAFKGYAANTNLIFSAQGVGYGITSSHDLTVNEWSHVAVVYESTKVTIYVNGKPWVYNGTLGAPDFVTYPLFINTDAHNQGGNFKGLLDEIQIFNTALTPEEIREKMHLTRTGTETNLVTYYQFNQNAAETGLNVIDRAKANHAYLSGAATRLASTAPVAAGTSTRLSVTTGGIKDFTGTDVTLEFPATGIYPNGDVVVSKLNTSPNQTPSGGIPLSTNYWIINSFGTNQTVSALTNIKFNNLGSFGTGTASNFKLYRRNFNAEGAWGTNIDGGDNLASNTLTFTPDAPCIGISSFGQFTLTNDAATAAPIAPCIVQSTATNAASLTGVATSNIQSAVSAPNFGTAQNFTISFWFKSSSSASDATILTDKNWGSGLNKGWVFALQSGILKFNIGDGSSHRIDITSGTAINDNQWHHVAASVTRTGTAVLYIDGVNKASTSATALLDIYSGNKLFIGTDVNSSYAYAGLVDEIKIWNTALTQTEIREKRHLTTTASETNLITYYQFNGTTGTEYDFSNGGNNLTLNTNASRTTATTPVGGGTSSTLNVTASGLKDFTGTDCQMTFPASGTYPNGDVVVSKITVSPDQLPSGGTPLSNTYWIINNYGSNAVFSPLTSLTFNNLTGFATGTASNFKLYKRNSNADGATWGTNIDGGDNLASNALTFTPAIPCMGITSFGQFTITNDAATSPPLTTAAECNISPLVGKAMSISTNGSYMLTPAMNLGSNTDEITLMAWIRPNTGTQSGFTGIITSETNAIGLIYRNNNELGLMWNDAQWSWASGVTVPQSEWSHVALVVARDSFKLFLNGKGIKNSANPVTLNLSNLKWYVGIDRGTSSRTFKGLIDEVCFYNRALDSNEVREKMHLIKDPTTDLTLKGYYQFNETNDVIWNKSDGNFTVFSGSTIPTRVTSAAPVASGTSQRMSVTTGGIKDFAAQHLTLEFPTSGTLPNGDIVVNELNAAPDQLPIAVAPLSNKYWIVNNYGTSPFTALTSIKFSNLVGFAGGTAGSYKLFKRASNAEGATWGTEIDAADVLSNSALTFSTGNNITSFSQFSIAKDAVIAIELMDFKVLLNDKKVDLAWQLANEKDVQSYIIERSFDAKSFVFLTQKNKGVFSTTDDTPQYGTNYYRLKIIGHDGNITYSPIKSVVFEGIKNNNFKIYPNPTFDRLNIEFVAEHAQAVDFELINVNGQIVYAYKLEGREGNNRLFFNTSQFPAGLYTLKIKQDKVVSVEKIVLE